MNEQEVARSIRIPKRLWDALDADAVRHKRSSVKHLEFLLSVYYREEVAQLKAGRLNEMRKDTLLDDPDSVPIQAREIEAPPRPQAAGKKRRASK